jgi:type I restriction enzyme, S subunit
MRRGEPNRTANRSPGETGVPTDLAPLPEGWSYVPLGALTDPTRGICYGIVQPGMPQEDGIPIIRVNNIKYSLIETDDVLKVSPEIERKYVRSRLRGQEVLVTLVGTIGQSAIVPSELQGWNVARAVGVIPVAEDVGPQWINLCIRTSAIQHYIRTWATTTVQATFNLKDLAKIPIPFPPKRERDAIVHILGVLDNKIELLRRMNRTSEEICRQLFQSWFVDFDPVQARAARRKAKGPDAETATLFPRDLTNSGMGLIPQGWKVATLGAEFNITMGQSPPGETYNDEGNGLPFYQGSTDFGPRFPCRRIYCTAPTRLAEAGDTLVSVRAPVGDVNMAVERSGIGRGVAAVRHKAGSGSYTYYHILALHQAFARFEADGTVFGSINKDSFHGIRCLVPPSDVVSAFSNAVAPFDTRINANESGVSVLADLRDTLLPKLLSGEFRILDLDRFLKEAGV